MEVAATDGVWHVRRRWAPRHLGSKTIWRQFRDRSRKSRRRVLEYGDVADPGCAPDFADGLVVAVAVLVIFLFVIFVGIPFLIALGELIFFVPFALVGVIGRVLFRRPWTVDAVSPAGRRSVWSVVGWKASGVARQFIADRIQATGSVPSEEEVSSAVPGV